MNTELDEALSAWIDGEVPSHDVLLRAIAQPDALATLRGLLEVRALLQTDALPSPATVAATQAASRSSRRSIRRVAGALRVGVAAMTLLTVGIGIGLGWPRGRTAAVEWARPPAADLIAQFTFETR